MRKLGFTVGLLACVLLCVPLASGRNYALVISAGAATTDDAPVNSCFWYNFLLIYQTLLNEGFAHEDIYALYGYGTNFNSRHACYQVEYTVPDYAVNRANIRAACNELAARMTPNDFLYVWWMGHGSPSGNNLVMYIETTGESVYDYEMANWLAPVAYDIRSASWMTCYSGGILDDLEGPRSIVMSSATFYESTYDEWLCDTWHAEFHYPERCAWAWETPCGICGAVDADTNNDNVVSFEEAFIYARDNTMNSHPQISDIGNLAPDTVLGGVGFRVAVDPVSQSVCAPPTDEVTYAVEVRRLGDFDEPVTLTVDGLPPGAGASFSVNGLPPPYTSTLTVSNVTGGSPGDYELIITGTSPSLQDSTSAWLLLADSLPGEPVLLEPPDGAVDVAREPTLEWVPAEQAAEYYLEIARDPGFTQVVYSATELDTVHEVDLRLDSATVYYWHVRGINGCGDGDYSLTFSFTTIEQPDYFTEVFVGDFDLDNFSVTFFPDGTGDYYGMCGGEIDALPTDPAGGARLYLGDDDYTLVSLSGGERVWLYGVSYGQFYVGSNGYLTFGSGDSDYTESLEDHFDRPRISGLFDDLDPRSQGTISWKQLGDRAAVTYQDVPEYGSSNNNTFQIELFFDGKIRVSWLQVDSGDSIVGLSAGNGLPDDFFESDLSDAGRCCRGDFDGDGYIGLADLAILLGNYPMPSGAEYEQGDFDEDGDVDLNDLAGLLAVYGTTCP